MQKRLGGDYYDREAITEFLFENVIILRIISI